MAGLTFRQEAYRAAEGAGELEAEGDREDNRYMVEGGRQEADEYVIWDDGIDTGKSNVT